jgi:hypothetical protein
VIMDREQMLRCLEQVDAYRASGLKGKHWAQANGVPLLSLQSWCAHAERWRARLNGVAAAAPVRASGFVAARVSAAAVRPPESPCVRLDVGTGASSVALHWPLAHSRELASWLREFTR